MMKLELNKNKRYFSILANRLNYEFTQSHDRWDIFQDMDIKLESYGSINPDIAINKLLKSL